MKEHIQKYINKKTITLFFSAALLIVAGGMIGWIAFQENQKGTLDNSSQEAKTNQMTENVREPEEVDASQEEIVISNKSEAQKEIDNMDEIMNSLSTSELTE